MIKYNMTYYLKILLLISSFCLKNKTCWKLERFVDFNGCQVLLFLSICLDLPGMARKLIGSFFSKTSPPPSPHWHMCWKISAGVDGGLSGGSSVRRPVSKDPHRHQRKFFSTSFHPWWKLVLRAPINCLCGFRTNSQLSCSLICKKTV